ncbi:MAG: transglutaminase domain-containing protein [Lachnospiraceae bacterium]|nr:transglutaminase domain-containing protein [Lachnospiraceae bacterium]
MSTRKSRAAKMRRFRKMLMEVIAFEVGLLVLLSLSYTLIAGGKYYKKVIIQAGAPVKEELFKKKDKYDLAFITNVAEITKDVPGDYEVEFKIDGKEGKSKLKVVDTTKPSGTANPQTVYNGAEIDPMSLVTDVKDNTLVSASFKKDDYDFKTLGEKQVVVVLTDLGLNKTEIETSVTIAEDKEPPVITGAQDIEVNIGDTIAYKDGVSVSDNLDNNIELQIDNSQVNMKRPGDYKVTYTAADSAGNSSFEVIKVTVKEPEEGVYNEDIVAYLAEKVLDQITTSDMTDTQKAYEIYKWCRNNIAYVNTSDKDDWVKGAYQGLTTRKGDCFIYFSTAKAMLNALGLDNVDIVKSDTSHSAHYWSLLNLGTGYYHYDATPRKGGGQFFMLTDEELEAYSSAHNNSHIFESGNYPERATGKFDIAYDK